MSASHNLGDGIASLAAPDAEVADGIVMTITPSLGVPAFGAACLITVRLVQCYWRLWPWVWPLWPTG